MQRRHLLALGAASAAVLALAGASVAWMKPPRLQGRFAPPVNEMMAAVARAVLDAALPADPAAQAAALEGHLRRLEATVSGMPPLMQAEVDRLLALLVAPPGRVALLGLHPAWPEASTAQVQTALETLRHSPLALRQQIFHALRDLTNGAYFADPAAWAVLGYPGPRTV